MGFVNPIHTVLTCKLIVSVKINIVNSKIFPSEMWSTMYKAEKKYLNTSSTAQKCNYSEYST